MFELARQLLQQATADRAFPAAVIEVGDVTTTLWRESFGRLTFDETSPRAQDDTVFDLASLTKVVATSPLVMQLVERGVLRLDEPVSARIPEWTGDLREQVTLRDLLAHCSGLPGHMPLFRSAAGEAEYTRAICSMPLEYRPCTRSTYSDLGFMLLGFILNAEVQLTVRLATMLAQMGIAEPLRFNPPQLWKKRIAPTEFDPWRGRLLIGEVHDENAWALGGVAGHAGLFGTAAAVGAFARHLLQLLGGRVGVVRHDTLECFITRRTDIPGSSRALGWDTMLPTSSCGTHMSPRAFGHTGFTGTSLWIDPDRLVYVVLLTNRVHPTRTNDAIRTVRPAVHDAVMTAL